MKPIILDFPWQPCQQINSLPEARLIYAIILTAWEDANKKISCLARGEARKWFVSKQFEEFCELLGISMVAIQKYLASDGGDD